MRVIPLTSVLSHKGRGCRSPNQNDTLGLEVKGHFKHPLGVFPAPLEKDAPRVRMTRPTEVGASRLARRIGASQPGQSHPMGRRLLADGHRIELVPALNEVE